MGDISNAIKYLYRQFILRDVLSFVTPGAIVVVTAFILFLPEPCLSQRLNTLFEYSRDMHWLLYIPLFGIFYLTGYAIQCFGRLIGIIRIHRLDRSSICQRFQNFRCGWADIPITYWYEAHRKIVRVSHATERYEWAQQLHERQIVLKQMCGNGFIAIVITGILLPVNHICAQASLILFFIIAFLLLCSLFWGYRAGELVLDDVEDKILSELNRGWR